MNVTFFTPRGVRVDATYREDTSDWNTLAACIREDEYALADRTWTGVALDVGAHIGGATLALLADNPELHVVAIEALPANVEVLTGNVAPFGDRCTVIEGAADCGTDPVTVAYGTDEGSEFIKAHRFIGGGIWQDGGPTGVRVEAKPVSLTSLVAQFGPISLMKIDCEGCEWSFLNDPAIADVAEIRGEYHPRLGFGPARLRELLEPTHEVTLDDTLPFGPFRATHR